jgi:hypothetical protein
MQLPIKKQFKNLKFKNFQHVAHVGEIYQLSGILVGENEILFTYNPLRTQILNFTIFEGKL